MNVYPPGTDFAIKAIITAASWRSSGISYEVTWWRESEHNTTWLPEAEFKTDAPKTAFGFSGASITIKGSDVTGALNTPDKATSFP